MTPEILSALIAACVALVVGMLTFIAAFSAVKGQIRSTMLDLAERYRKAIFDKRIDVYAKVWQITAALSSRRLRLYEATEPEEIISVLKQVDKWYNETVGGLLISEESRKCFFQLREMIDELSSNPEKRQELYSKVWRRKMNFRVSLRSDLLILESQKYRQHTEEEWKLD
jgi:hypothetical protein